MPLVLVQNPVIVNEGYDWKDIEGEQYHFPNQYKNRVKPDTPFVYYRGTRRLDGKRAVPEYFGHGYIGAVWRDAAVPDSNPKKDWAWYCEITDYSPFPTPVPAKHNGEFIERIARNHWSVGVRPLPPDGFDTIMALAGIVPIEINVGVVLPDMSTITVREADYALLIPRTPMATRTGLETPRGRYSKNALPIGRRAEEIAHRFLVDQAAVLGATNIRWLARDGITPGWDLQYENLQGEVIAVEVKGATGPLFGSIDITVGEWNAASRLGDRYWLYLIADCCSTHPAIQRIQNPARLVQNATAQLAPVVYRFSLTGQA